MKLARIVSQLSPRNLQHTLMAKRTAPFVMATIDAAAIQSIKSRAYELTDVLMDLKYFHMEPWIVENLKRAYTLGLIRPKGQRVLDIGTGFGLFPYVCWYLGQEAYAIDIPRQHLYNEITDALRVRKVQEAVTPFKALPRFDDKFDIITAYQIAFNHPCSEGTWGVKEWAFFLDDIFDTMMSEKGRLHLELNHSDTHGDFYSPEIKKLFLSRGGKVSGELVTFEKQHYKGPRK